MGLTNSEDIVIELRIWVEETVRNLGPGQNSIKVVYSALDSELGLRAGATKEYIEAQFEAVGYILDGEGGETRAIFKRATK